jgi:O-antigen ligase
MPAARRVILALSLLVPLVVDPFGADTQATKAGLLAICGSLLLLIDARERLAGGPVARVDVPELLLLLLLLWAATSLLWATNPALGLPRVLSLIGVLGLARGVRAEVDGAPCARRWLTGLLACGAAAMALDALVSARARAELPEAAIKHASQIFGHDNMAASWAVTLAPLLLAFALGASRGALRWVWAAVLAGLLAYLSLLDSRAGLLGAALAVLVTGGLFVLRDRLRRASPPGRRALLVAGALVLAGGLLPLSEGARGVAKDGYYEAVKLTGIDIGNVSFRQILWRKTIEMVHDQPLSGVGAGNFPVVFPRYEHYEVPKPHAHNDALQVLAELGLPGLLLFFALLAALALRLARELAGCKDELRFALLAGLAGLLVVFAAGGMFEVPFALAATAAALGWAMGLSSALQEPAPARGAPRRLATLLLLLLGLFGLGGALLRLPASWLLWRAEQASAEGRLDDALGLYGDVAALHTGAYHPERMQGVLERQRGRLDAALLHLRAARALDPWGAQRMVDEGDVLYDLRRYDEAADAYEAAFRATPMADEPFLKLQLALAQSGQLRRAIDAIEQRVRQDEHVTLDVLLKLADMCRVYATSQASGEAQERALAEARHWYAVVAQEAPLLGAQHDETFKDLTHRLQIRPGAPDAWFKGTYRRWLEQGGWGIPGPALQLELADPTRRLYPGWKLPEQPLPSGSWRQPSIWEDG